MKWISFLIYIFSISFFCIVLKIRILHELLAYAINFLCTFWWRTFYILFTSCVDHNIKIYINTQKRNLTHSMTVLHNHHYTVYIFEFVCINGWQRKKITQIPVWYSVGTIKTCSFPYFPDRYLNKKGDNSIKHILQGYKLNDETFFETRCSLNNIEESL